MDTEGQRGTTTRPKTKPIRNPEIQPNLVAGNSPFLLGLD